MEDVQIGILWRLFTPDYNMEEDLEVTGQQIILNKEYSICKGSWVEMSQKEVIIQSTMEIAQHLPLPESQDNSSTDLIHNIIGLESPDLIKSYTYHSTDQIHHADLEDEIQLKDGECETIEDGTKNLDLQETRKEIGPKEIDSKEPKEKEIMHVDTLKRDTSQISTISTSSSPYKRDFSDTIAFSPLMSGAVRSVNPIIEQLLKSIQLLEDNDESLKYLDLRDVQVFSALHGTKLAKALQKNTTLEVLDLSNTKLQTNTAIEIAKALEVNKGLKVLIMSNNLIQPEGMRELAQMLKVNTCLRELVLSNQKYSTGSSAEEAFAEALKRNSTLLKLVLKISGAPARTAIDRGLSKNNALARSPSDNCSTLCVL